MLAGNPLSPKREVKDYLSFTPGHQKKLYIFFTSQRLHPKSVTKPVKASEDYIFIVSE